MAVREGRWDCKSCGKTMIRGPLTECPGCGASRPEQVKFYLPSDARIVTDSEELEVANAGPNWVCEHCGEDNIATDGHCTECGASRGESLNRPVIEYGLDEVPRHGDEYVPAPSVALAHDSAATVTPNYTSSVSRSEPKYSHVSEYLPSGFDWRILVVGVGVALLFVVFLCLFLSNTATTATVVEVSWERSVNVQELQTVTEEGWSLPSDARLIDSFLKHYGYENVVDHYETKYSKEPKEVEDGTEPYVCGEIDKGNGYFEDKYCTRTKYKTIYVDVPYQDPVYRQDPVKKTWYVYTVDQWVSIGREVASGKSHSAHWPSVSTGSNIRTNGAQESYWVTFRPSDNEELVTKAYRYDTWLKFEVGAAYKAKRNKLGGLSVSLE